MIIIKLKNCKIIVGGGKKSIRVRKKQNTTFWTAGNRFSYLKLTKNQLINLINSSKKYIVDENTTIEIH